MSKPNHNRRQTSTLTTLLGILFVIAVFIYRYWLGGIQAQPIPTPVVATETFPAESADSAPAAPTDPAPAETTEAFPAATEETAPQAAPANFDFYVLTLSWSPDYCASNGSDDPQQCSVGKKLGFVLHGLWPQYQKGYPSDCSTQKLPENVRAKFPGLYPSPKLYDHEWDKHGTCSGLTPEQYLALSKRLKESVVIPESYRKPPQPIRVTPAQFKQEFVAVNPGLAESSLAVYCSGSGRFLKELYVCFSPEGQPTPCSAEVLTKAVKSCPKANFLVRNVK